MSSPPTVPDLAYALTAAGGIIAIMSYLRHSSSSSSSSRNHRHHVPAQPGQKHLRAGTRKSALAMVQTEWVVEKLSEIRPDVHVDILEGVQAMGDNMLTQSLKELAAKTPGLFTKELEDGLLSNRYDFVVHSLKDMPTTLPDGLVLAAITQREDPRDALVVNHKWRGRTLKDLPDGSVVGTSSVRREAMLKRKFPQLHIKLIRGNVNTRLHKVEHGEYDAIILARAGLVRLGFQDYIQYTFDANEDESFLYSVGQGALGLQCRADDVETIEILKRLSDVSSTARCLAERALLRELQGGCQVPLGVSSRVFGTCDDVEMVELTCQISSPEGTLVIEGRKQAPIAQCEVMGMELGRELLTSMGAKHLIEGWTDDRTRLARPVTYGSAENPSR